MLIRYAGMKRRGEPIVPSKRGRKATFTEEEELQIVQKTNNHSVELNSLTVGSKATLLHTMEETLRSKRPNKDANLSPKLIQRFIRKHKLRVQGKPKNAFNES